MRAGRGTAGAAVATTVAATAHTLSGGQAPPAWLLLAVIALAAPLAVALTGRRPALWRTSAVVAASQLLLHFAFATVGTAAPAGGHGGHVHGAAIILGEAPASTAAGLGTALFALDPLMIAGHALAAVVTIALVTRGERALATIAAGLRRLAARVDVAVPLLPAVPRPVAPARPTPAAAVFLVTLSRRGPPALAR